MIAPMLSVSSAEDTMCMNGYGLTQMQWDVGTKIPPCKAACASQYMQTCKQHIQCRQCNPQSLKAGSLAIAIKQHTCNSSDTHVHAGHTGMQVGASGQSPQEHLKAESQQAGMLSFMAAMPAGVFCCPGKSI